MVTTLHHGEALDILPTLPGASVDAVVCDPPYALRKLPQALITETLTAWLSGDRSYVPGGRGFMGRDWDQFVPPPAVWDECLRVLKPGGYLLAFASPRTADLMGLSIRLAGAEILDSIDWIFGSGFPKSAWQLKPAHEPIILARKPFTGSMAANVLKHGTGAINIDGCRVAGDDVPAGRVRHGGGTNSVYAQDPWTQANAAGMKSPMPAGRWPTNIVLSHPPLLDEHGQPVGDACASACIPGCPVADMDAQSGVTRSNARGNKGGSLGYHGGTPQSKGWECDDSGGASRYFPVFRYQAKAPAKERPRLPDGTAWPTVKPLTLLRWLVRLVTPPGGTVLDWCAGTGTTAEAAALEDMRAICIERDPVAAELFRIRLTKPSVVGVSGDAA